jgi:hypothetical protein
MCVSLMFVGQGLSLRCLWCSEAGSVARRLQLNTAAGGRTGAKRAVTVLLVVVAGWLLSFGLGTATALADDPPVISESFESVSGLPAGWRFVEYTRGNSTATIAIGAAADGTHFLRIVSSKPNHARVVVPVRVTPNTSYRFHVMVKASGANANMAAVLGTEGPYSVTGSVRTDTQWQPLDLYIKAGPRTSIDLSMGLGYYGQINVGTADFDAVTVTQVSAIPNGATVAEPPTTAAAPTKSNTAADSTVTQGPNRAIWVFVGILVVVGIAGAAYLIRRGDPEPTPEADTEPRADAKSDQAGAVEPRGNSHADADPGIDSEPGRIPDPAD